MAELSSFSVIGVESELEVEPGLEIRLALGLEL
jgi:hypothetical protein